jgi:hypothetical protein
MKKIILEIMAEVFSILGIATREIERGGISKCSLRKYVAAD